jgi:hypothetical protein
MKPTVDLLCGSPYPTPGAEGPGYDLTKPFQG